MEQLSEQQKRRVINECRKRNPIWYDHVVKFVNGEIHELPNEESYEEAYVCGHSLDITKIDQCIIGEIQKFNQHYEHKNMVRQEWNTYHEWMECKDCIDFGMKLYRHSTTFENVLSRDLFLVALYEFYMHRGFIKESTK